MREKGLETERLQAASRYTRSGVVRTQTSGGQVLSIRHTFLSTVSKRPQGLLHCFEVLHREAVNLRRDVWAVEIGDLENRISTFR